MGIPAEHLRPEPRRAWLAPLYALGLPEGGKWDPPPCYEDGDASQVRTRTAFLFRRGFVESVRLCERETVLRFTENAGAIFDLTPLLHLRVWNDLVEHYDIEPRTSPTRTVATLLRALAGLPASARLRTLDLRSLGISDPGAHDLAASLYLSRNLRLMVEGNRITAEGRQALEARFGTGVSCGRDWDPNAEDDIPF